MGLNLRFLKTPIEKVFKNACFEARKTKCFIVSGNYCQEF